MGQCVKVLLCVLLAASSLFPAARAAFPGAPSLGHVFVIVLENEDYDETFGDPAAAPYLSSALPQQGALLVDYYGTGHQSNDNYLAMISGQGPNAETQLDCQAYTDFIGTPPQAGLQGQAIGEGCVYPVSVPNLTDQLRARNLTWRGYMEDMGNTPSREAAACGHPALNSVDGTQTATAQDQYATRHDPFMYFHSVIDDATYCAQHVVNLTLLTHDLASVATTPNFSFITPNLCHDGHDSPCKDGEPGGVPSAEAFLRQLVPQIQRSPAYQQDGLIIITFDESEGADSDSSACCGETLSPNALLTVGGVTGPGGGRIGAIVLGPRFVAPGTVSFHPYNHYSLLRTLEDAFGLGYLGYAAGSAQASFGTDVFSHAMPARPVAP